MALSVPWVVVIVTAESSPLPLLLFPPVLFFALSFSFSCLKKSGSSSIFFSQCSAVACSGWSFQHFFFGCPVRLQCSHLTEFFSVLNFESSLEVVFPPPQALPRSPRPLRCVPPLLRNEVVVEVFLAVSTELSDRITSCWRSCTRALIARSSKRSSDPLRESQEGKKSPSLRR